MAEGRIPTVNGTMAVPDSIPEENVVEYDVDPSPDKKCDPQMSSEEREKISRKLYPPLPPLPEGAETWLDLSTEGTGRDIVRAAMKHDDSMYTS